MTTFSAAISLCGLSQQQAATYFDVSKDTVKSWSSGRSNPPIGVWLMLRDLFYRIEDAADFAADHMDLNGIDPRAFNNLTADLGPDPLPDGAEGSAGAMALLMALRDRP